MARTVRRAPRVAIVLLAVGLAACGRPLPPSVPAAPPGDGWTQTGIASWYGDPFHGRTTASGEVYDMEAMTAAHLTLPFGTRIRVDNLDNGRSTSLVVNDRGPYVDGRIVDVSRAGARELGLLGPGIARVRLSLLDAPYGSECWEVQVGAYADRAGAERMAARMEARGQRASLQPGPDGMVRVVLGPFSRGPQAVQVAGRHDGYVVTCGRI